MVKVIEYHFVSSHELFECTVRNSVEIWITNKGTQTLGKFFFIFCFLVLKKKITLQYMPNVWCFNDFAKKH